MKQLFLRMKLRHKLSLSGLALIVPLAFALFMLVQEKNIAIHFVDQEIEGVHYIEPLRGIMESLPQHRGLSRDYLEGNTSLKGELFRLETQIEAELKEVDAIDAQLGADLKTTEQWKAFKERWQTLKKDNSSLSAQESFAQHNTVIHELQAFIVSVAESSKLVLDPNLDSYYLMRAVVFNIPEITDMLAQTRDVGTSAARVGQLDNQHATNLLLLKSNIERDLEGIVTSLSAAAQYNPLLDELSNDAKTNVTESIEFKQIFQEIIKKTTTSGNKSFTLDADAYFEQGDTAISNFLDMDEEIEVTMVLLLETRRHELQSARNIAVGLASVFLFAGSLLGWLSLKGMNGPLAQMLEGVQQIAAGNLEVTIASTTQDEIGELATGFSNMLDGLREGEGQKRESARVSAMIENAPDNFLFADEDYVLQYMNPASIKNLRKLEHLLPFGVDQLIGRSIDDFHKDPGRIRRILSNEGILPYTGQIHLGDEVLELNASAILDHDQQRIGTMATWKIITEKEQLNESLRAAAESVSASSQKLSLASSEMHIAASETSQQAEQVASISGNTNQNVQSAAAAAEEMSVTVKEISKNVNTASQITERAVNMAESMNDTINKLDASNTEIGNVVKVISTIAGQTNLLALNATIEAARAGDAGKGFAVVANEVKELAKGTSQATDEIRQQIGVIQANTKGAIASIEEITEIIKQNNQITTSIAAAVEQQTMTTNEISKNMSEAAKGTEDVVEDIGGIISSTESTNSGAESIKEASDSLAAMAQQLSDLTNEANQD